MESIAECRNCAHWEAAKGYSHHGMTFAPCERIADVVVKLKSSALGYVKQGYVTAGDYRCRSFESKAMRSDR